MKQEKKELEDLVTKEDQEYPIQRSCPACFCWPKEECIYDSGDSDLDYSNKYGINFNGPEIDYSKLKKPKPDTNTY